MKEYTDILRQLDSKSYTLIHHEWGQSAVAVYNQIAQGWDSYTIGRRIFVISRKSYGCKQVVDLLHEQGLDPQIVGKGAPDIRMLEIIKDTNQNLSHLYPEQYISFSFRGKTYHANVGTAVFSKTGLDEGTAFLLDTVLNTVSDFDGKTVGDLGSGWGAISLILASEFSRSQVIAFEKDLGSLQACIDTLRVYKNTTVIHADLTDPGDRQVQEYVGRLDYIISNFLFHITTGEREHFFQNAKNLLRKHGTMFFVVEGKFRDLFEHTASKYFNTVLLAEYKRYKVFDSK